jgi:hypothetical protein
MLQGQGAVFYGLWKRLVPEVSGEQVEYLCRGLGIEGVFFDKFRDIGDTKTAKKQTFFNFLK